MKRFQHPAALLSGLVLLGLGATSVRADYPSQVLAQNPSVYYQLNDNLVIQAADVATNKGSVGAAANGYYKGASFHPYSPGALVGSSDGAANFSGAAGTAVVVPYNASLNPSAAFTVEGWLNPAASFAAGSGTLAAAISSGVFSSPRSGWLIYQSETGWNFRMYNTNGTATSLNITGGGAPTVGTWYHVAVAYDGTTAKLYVNGAEAASGSPVAQTNTAPKYVPSQGGGLYIGGRSDNSFWWTGQADEVAIYGSALAPATITAHYQNGINATPATPYDQLVAGSNPLAYYRLDEPEFAINDLPPAHNAGTTGSANDGFYYPGVNDQVAGPRPPDFQGFTSGNTAAGFNGNAGGISTPFSLNGMTSFTVMGWLKRGTTHSLRGGYFGQNDLLEIGDADNGANVEIWINAYGTNIKFPYPFLDNQWGLLAIVGDGTKVTAYTNGVAAGSVTQTVATYGTSSYSFNIGGQGIFNATGDEFLGSIDEVAVLPQALTGSQIQSLYYASNVKPVITQQPVAPSRSLVPGNVVTLTVGATGTPPLGYQWRKGGNNLTGKTDASLVFNSITSGDAGSYDVIVSNNYGSVTSSIVTLTIGATDTTAPTIQYADAGRSFTTVRLFFSEPLDAATAQNKANYSISDGTSTLAISSATLVGAPGTRGDNQVDLVTAAQTPGKTYTVTINGVKDQTAPGNTIANGSTIQFTAWKLLNGYLRFEHYDNITGAADSDITKGLSDPRVIARTPTLDAFITGKFDTRTIFPDDSHEQYMALITGWIVPTETDDYDFFLMSDDAGRLYISSTDVIPDPATATTTAIETGCCNPFKEPGSPQTTSAPLHLVKGQRYGVLAILKEAGGGDHLEVAWRKTSDTTPAASLQPIPGQYLQTYVDPNSELTITTQPTDQPGVLPSPVVGFLTNDFTQVDGGFTVQNTTPPPPGPFAFVAGTGWVADGSEDACTGPYNSKLTSPQITVPVNDQVALTFTHRYSFEPGAWDGGQVWISVNGGAFTPVAGTNFTANGYPPGTIVGTGVMQNQAAFHDDSPGYSAGTFITSSVLLGSFHTGDKLVVQFVGAWDECTAGTHPNWVIKGMGLAYGTAPVPSTFTVAATATKQGTPIPFTYQWQRNDGSGWVDILNENNATYRFFPTSADFAANYRVAIRVPGNELISNSVKLNSTGSKPIISIARNNGIVTINFTGTLQSAPAVTGPYTAVSGATSPYTVPNPTTGTRFYQAVQ